MFVPYEALLLDIGNSRTKAAVKQDGALRLLGAVEDDDIGQLIEQSQALVFAAVGNPLLADWIQTQARKRQIQYIEAKVASEAFGIRCAYETPSSLGIDRWLAILGTSRSVQGAFAVIDYGTAITCDFVDNQRTHLGGWILPGVTSMREALIQRTQQVNVRQDGWHCLDIGQNTLDCVDAGCLTAAEGVVSQALQYGFRHFSDFTVVICGGDGEQFWRRNREECLYRPDVVFKGMELFLADK